VTVTNTISKDQGYFKISKVFSSPAYTGDFTIGYLCTDAAGTNGSVNLAGGATSAAIGPIDTHNGTTAVTCTATETLPSNPTGYTFGVPSYSPTGGVVTITKGLAAAAVEVTVTNTITRDLGNLAVTKYHDVDNSGSKQGSEPFLNGWDCYLDLNTNGTFDGVDVKLTTAGTDESEAPKGEVLFENLPTGTYQICEVPKADWYNSDPGAASIAGPGKDPCESASVLKDTATFASFGNYQKTKVQITKTVGLAVPTHDDGNIAFQIRMGASPAAQGRLSQLAQPTPQTVESSDRTIGRQRTVAIPWFPVPTSCARWCRWATARPSSSVIGTATKRPGSTVTTGSPPG